MANKYTHTCCKFLYNFAFFFPKIFKFSNISNFKFKFKLQTFSKLQNFQTLNNNAFSLEGLYQDADHGAK